MNIRIYLRFTALLIATIFPWHNTHAKYDLALQGPTEAAQPSTSKQVSTESNDATHVAIHSSTTRIPSTSTSSTTLDHFISDPSVGWNR